jgi:DNA-binding transcriptional MerR regulator
MNTFRSGITARLAGIPVQTLRVWERRYQLTGAKLPGRHQRLYSDTDVERLVLIKRLVDLGQSIGSLASLDLPSLRVLQDSIAKHQFAAEPSETQNVRGTLRIALVGRFLEQVRIPVKTAAFAIQEEIRVDSLDSMYRSYRSKLPQLNAVLFEIPNLLDESADDIVSFQEQHDLILTLVLYRFAPSSVIRKLRAKRISVMRMPLDEIELEEACSRFLKQASQAVSASALPPFENVPPTQKYPIETLLKLSHIESSVFCECPRQLAQLLLSVASFEEYSAHCANRDSNDALIHRRLQSDAAIVRSLLEDSLARLLSYEGIDIETLPKNEVLKSVEREL